MTRTDITKQPPDDLYRSLLLELPDVFAANVLMDDNAAICEIHIVAGLGRNPKQISRDVQSALLAAFNLRVDHRVISIAQLASNPFERQAQAQRAEMGSRIQCMEVSTRVVEQQYRVSVCLRYGEHDFNGQAVCRNTTTQRMHAAVQATLNAVHSVLGVEDLFTIVTTQSTTVGGIPIALTLLEYSYAIEERLLIGAAPQTEDVAVGFVKSTLDALNRNLSLAASGHSI